VAGGDAGPAGFAARPRPAKISDEGIDHRARGCGSARLFSRDGAGISDAHERSIASGHEAEAFPALAIRRGKLAPGSPEQVANASKVTTVRTRSTPAARARAAAHGLEGRAVLSGSASWKSEIPFFCLWPKVRNSFWCHRSLIARAA